MRRREFIALCLGGVASASIPWLRSERSDSFVPIRDRPLDFSINPYATDGDFPDAVVLERIRQKVQWWPGMDVPNTLHWLRIFGVRGTPEFQSDRTSELIAVLTDTTQIEQRFGQRGAVVRTADGVRYLSRLCEAGLEKKAVPAHPRQELAVFAAIGLPASTPLFVDKNTHLLRDAIVDCLRNIQIRESNVQEPEWITEALAHYVSGSAWTNRWGESITLDGWVDFLLNRPVHQYCCRGTHMLHSLALIWRADQHESFLNHRSRSLVESACRQFTATMMRTQRDDGSWGLDWAHSSSLGGQTLAGIHLTGHILESQLFLPRELRISDDAALGSARYLCESILVAEDAAIRSNYCPYAHSAKAILYGFGS
jgi:hypothetical protein